MTQFYFDTNGNYGEAEDLIIAHTEDFDDKDWAMIRDASPELRQRVVELILRNKHREQIRTLRGL